MNTRSADYTGQAEPARSATRTHEQLFQSMLTVPGRGCLTIAESHSDIAGLDKNNGRRLEKAQGRGRMEMGDRGPGQDSLLSRAIASEWIPPGLFFIALGVAALWMSRDYSLGDLNRMGPGYFPRMLSLGMIGLGVLIVLRGLPELAGAKGLDARLDRSFWLIPISMVVFGLSVERIGLVAALGLTLAIAGVAHREARIKEIAISIVVLIALLVLIFIVVLRLPLRLWPEF